MLQNVKPTARDNLFVPEPLVSQPEDEDVGSKRKMDSQDQRLDASKKKRKRFTREDKKKFLRLYKKQGSKDAEAFGEKYSIPRARKALSDWRKQSKSWSSSESEDDSDEY